MKFLISRLGTTYFSGFRLIVCGISTNDQRSCFDMRSWPYAAGRMLPRLWDNPVAWQGGFSGCCEPNGRNALASCEGFDSSVLGSWVKPYGTRLDISKGAKRAIRLPKILVLDPTAAMCHPAGRGDGARAYSAVIEHGDSALRRASLPHVPATRATDGRWE